MTPRRGARLLVGLLAASALLPSAAAHAERVVVADSVADAEAWVSGAELELVPAPQEVSVDIVRTTVSWGKRRLDVLVRFEDLQQRSHHGTLARIRTPGKTFDLVGSREGSARPTIELTSPRDDVFACQGLRIRWDGAADVVRLSVRTACLGSPRWVRVGVKAAAAPAADADAMVVLFADDARRDGRADSNVALGPRISRG